MVNPNAKKVNGLIKAMSRNGGLCTCEDNSSENKKCPCTNYVESGECVCGLYVKQNSTEEKPVENTSNLDLESRINKLTEENAFLKYTNENLKKDVSKAREERDEKDVEIEKLKLQEEELSKQCNNLRIKSGAMKAKEEERQRKEKEVYDGLYKKIDDAREENFKLSAKIGEYEGKIEALKKTSFLDRVFNWKSIMECL